MTLERRHFEFIAATIREFGYPQERPRLAQHFANECKRTNPNFDRDRFLKACGVEA